MAWASITKYSPFFLEPPPTPAKYKDVRPQTWTPLEARLFRVSSFLMSFHKPFKKKSVNIGVQVRALGVFVLSVICYICSSLS